MAKKGTSNIKNKSSVKNGKNLKNKEKRSTGSRGNGRGKNNNPSRGNNRRKNRMDKRRQWEELEDARKKRSMLTKVLGVVIIAAIIALLVTYGNLSSPGDNDYEDIAPYQIVGNSVAVPLSDISSSARYYSYDSGGKDVKFFVVRGSDGDVHTAFDACEVCYMEKKGYYQDGSYMVCRNCGNRYTTNQIGTANQGGGCWPGYIDHAFENNNVMIDIADLDSGRVYF